MSYTVRPPIIGVLVLGVALDVLGSGCSLDLRATFPVTIFIPASPTDVQQLVTDIRAAGEARGYEFSWERPEVTFLLTSTVDIQQAYWNTMVIERPSDASRARSLFESALFEISRASGLEAVFQVAEGNALGRGERGVIIAGVRTEARVEAEGGEGGREGVLLVTYPLDLSEDVRAMLQEFEYPR